MSRHLREPSGSMPYLSFGSAAPQQPRLGAGGSPCAATGADAMPLLALVIGLICQLVITRSAKGRARGRECVQRRGREVHNAAVENTDEKRLT